jgi:hypothetical protein
MVHSFLSIHLRYFFPQTRGTLVKNKRIFPVQAQTLHASVYHPPVLDATVFGNMHDMDPRHWCYFLKILLNLRLFDLR